MWPGAARPCDRIVACGCNNFLLAMAAAYRHSGFSLITWLAAWCRCCMCCSADRRNKGERGGGAARVSARGVRRRARRGAYRRPRGRGAAYRRGGTAARRRAARRGDVARDFSPGMSTNNGRHHGRALSGIARVSVITDRNGNQCHRAYNDGGAWRGIVPCMVGPAACRYVRHNVQITTGGCMAVVGDIR